MPSVPRVVRERAARPGPCGRHGAPGGGSATKLGQRRRAPTRRPERLGARERAHRVDEPAARAAPRAAAAASSSRWSAASSRRRRAAAIRQRASGRRRSTPSPVHGASSSTRSNAPSRTGRRRPSATTGATDVARPSRAAARAHESAAAPGCRSAATTSPSSPMRSAARGRLAARRGRDVEHALARLRVEHARRPPGSPGPAAWRGRRATAASAPRSPVCRTSSASGDERARLDVDARRRAARRSTASAVVPHRVHPQRDRRRLVVELRASRARRRRRARRRTLARSSRDATCGCRSTRRRRRRAAATAARARASARSTPFDEARGRARRRRSTVSPTAACAGTPSTSWNAPSRSAARTGGSSDVDRSRSSTRREQEVERALHADACRRRGR